MPFAMILARRPPAYRSGGVRKFQEHLGQEARSWLDGGPMLLGDLYVRIVWFNGDRTQGDVDNISKPICDALRSIVYPDDSIVVKRLAQRVDTARGPGSYELVEPGSPSIAYDELIRLLGEKHAHITYIEVGTIAAQRVVFGPIDGDIP